MTAFDPAHHPNRLNLGCGFDHRAGYLNVDFHAFHKPDLVADVRELPMLPSGHYVEIVAQDVLEHLPRTDTLRALQEWNRLLVNGGQLHLRVPSLEGLFALFRRSQDFARHEELAQCLFGTQAYTGDFHHTAFTDVLLRGYLERSGFGDVTVTIRDEWLYAPAVALYPQRNWSAID